MEHDLTALDLLVRSAIVLALVLANGYFVCIEFALVGARHTRIEALAKQGVRRARIAQHAIRHLDRYISGTQLGITLASLGLGWVGEQTVAAMLVQAFDGLPAPWDAVATHGVAGAVAFLLITFLHIVLGELAPKSVALLYPERVSVWLAGPLVAFSRLLAPFIWTLNGAANAIVRAFGMEPPTEIERVHSPEEIAMLVRESHRHGILSARPREMIEGVFDLAETTAEMVMTPRTDVVAVEASSSLDEVVEVLLDAGHARLPVYEEDMDHVVGLLLARDVWQALYREERAGVPELMRPPYFVPASKRIQPLIPEMLEEKVQLAVVIDEFGGTAGIVTVEDLVEEIVGEIQDEDESERPEIEERAAGLYSVAASALVDDLNERLGLQLPRSDHYTTVGGYVLERVGRIPRVGDEVAAPGGTIRVQAMDGRRIDRLVIDFEDDGGTGSPEEAEEEEEGEGGAA